MYCDTNTNVKQAEKMLCKLFSELSIVRKYLTLVLFGSFSIVCTISVGRTIPDSKTSLKFHSDLFLLKKYIGSSSKWAALNNYQEPGNIELIFNMDLS